MAGPVTIGGVRFDVNTMLFCSAALVLGSQLVLFWTFSEIFATGEGLLPPDPKLFAAFDYITLEVGLAVGGGMFLAGLVGGVAAVAVPVGGSEVDDVGSVVVGLERQG